MAAQKHRRVEAPQRRSRAAPTGRWAVFVRPRTEPLVPVFPLWEQHGLFYCAATEGRFQVFAQCAGPRTNVDRFDATHGARPPVKVEEASHDSVARIVNRTASLTAYSWSPARVACVKHVFGRSLRPRKVRDSLYKFRTLKPGQVTRHSPDKIIITAPVRSRR